MERGPDFNWEAEILRPVATMDEQSDAEIAACEVDIDPDGLESVLLNELGARGETIVAFALAPMVIVTCL